MPIYEYRRKDGTTFEILQSITDPPLEKDPETGQEVVRVLHAPAVHFKGSGFYNTDYGTKRRAREMEKEKGSSNGDKPAGKAADAGKDAKPAAGSSATGGSGGAEKKKG
jgi:putative FmdB family regulatory protein